jgi:sporulation protein YlmC with PRC-barrel domain
MKKIRLAALLCTSALFVPSYAFSQATEQQRPANNACATLVTYLEENRHYEFPITLEQARAQQESQDEEGCRTSIERINASLDEDEQLTQQQAQSGQQEGGGTEIVVEQRPPTITVEQAAPEVTVQQAQPQVAVQQPQPEIFVHQPAPTVTVDIPQPEITVRMPEPDVSVSMAQPQVQVDQPQPQVRLSESGKPQVEIEQSQAEVTLQQRQQQAEVQVTETGEANVRYEREEPRVVVNEAEGQPNVRIERMEGQEAAAAGQQQPVEQAEQQSAAAEPQAAPETTGSIPRDVRVSTLLDTPIVSQQGEEIGAVEQVMVNPDTGDTLIVIGLSDTFAEGGKQIALSLEDLSMRGEELVARLSDEQLRQAPEWQEQEGFREAEGDQNATIGTTQ